MYIDQIIRQPKNPTARVWRYLDLPKFIYLLDKRKLYFARADRFEDQHEGATPLEQKEWELQRKTDTCHSLEEFRRRQREWSFVSCWSCSEHESHALWRLFCGPKHGVAIFTQYRELSALGNANPNLDSKVGLVDYGREDAMPPNTLFPFFRKRKAFAYEEEARWVMNIYGCTDVRDESGKLSPPRLHLEKPLDLKTFIEGIRIHPEADAAYQEVLRSVIQKFAPELIDRVGPSEMSKPPVF